MTDNAGLGRAGPGARTGSAGAPSERSTDHTDHKDGLVLQTLVMVSDRPLVGRGSEGASCGDFARLCGLCGPWTNISEPPTRTKSAGMRIGQYVGRATNPTGRDVLCALSALRRS